MGELQQQREPLVDSYLAAVLSGDRVTALVLMREALAAGIPLPLLYQDVLQPALYEIGRRWERGQIDVATEHLATAITRSVMDQCVSIVKPLPSGPPTILATCMSHELHELGLRMVADSLELDGWNVLYLGANMPLDPIVALAVQYRVAGVIVSITLGKQARPVYELAQALRQSPIGATVKLLVGGQPFHRISGLWRQVGADGTAPDAIGAVEWVRSQVPLVREPPLPVMARWDAVLTTLDQNRALLLGLVADQLTYTIPLLAVPPTATDFAREHQRQMYDALASLHDTVQAAWVHEQVLVDEFVWAGRVLTRWGVTSEHVAQMIDCYVSTAQTLRPWEPEAQRVLEELRDYLHHLARTTFPATEGP
ncbi:MAG: hypothetical protein HGA45_06645 [Chloroflexales bacterium]|nr:hypothetical protein [Chloroflexales bacterium]